MKTRMTISGIEPLCNMTDLGTTLEIQEILREHAGWSIRNRREDGYVVVTVSAGHYGEPGSVVIEVEGSPIRSWALVRFRRPPRPNSRREDIWRNASLYLFDRNGKASRQLKAARDLKARKVIEYAAMAALIKMKIKNQKQHNERELPNRYDTGKK